MKFYIGDPWYPVFRKIYIVSPTVLAAPKGEYDCCFSAYPAFKTAFYSFSRSKQELIKRLLGLSTWLETLENCGSPGGNPRNIEPDGGDISGHPPAGSSIFRARRKL